MSKTLKGSERAPLSGATRIGKADPNERLEVSVLLRNSAADGLRAHVAKLAANDRSAAHLTREEFARRHGAANSDIALVRRFAQDHGLSVVAEDAAQRTVVLSGTVSRFSAAFGVELERYEHENGTYRGRSGPILLPDELSPVVEGVLGLDDRPVAKAHLRPHPFVNDTGGKLPTGSFEPTQIAALYGFPAGTGAGETIAIIELGGGYRASDLKKYFAEVGVPKPVVSAVSVDHAKNRSTGQYSGPDGEVMLDIEVAGAIAPGAKIVVYFAPNTDAGFLDAINAAVHDATHKPSVISISWGGAESTWTAQSLNAYDQAFQNAAAMGVTVCAASGDNGSSDGVSDGADHVDFPASSPFVLACGGTSLNANGGAIGRELVWNNGANGGASGGGVSQFFPLPQWQNGLSAKRSNGTAVPLTKRGVPDVSGDADPSTGYHVRVDSTETVFGGTSAVAPLWAALIARINGAKGRAIGYLNPSLYSSAKAMRDIVDGNNGSFASASGWDACTGLGSPDGAKIAALF